MESDKDLLGIAGHGYDISLVVTGHCGGPGEQVREEKKGNFH
jgi:hypothetical protein